MDGREGTLVPHGLQVTTVVIARGVPSALYYYIYSYRELMNLIERVNATTRLEQVLVVHERGAIPECYADSDANNAPDVAVVLEVGFVDARRRGTFWLLMHQVRRAMPGSE
jgi:hypothetical protein